MSRLRTIIAAFAAGIAVLSAGMARGDVTSDQLAYSVGGDGKATITGIKSGIAPADINGALNIPPEIKGHPVVAIAQNAFKGKDRITSVTIPDSVTSVGYGAFANCTLLRSASTGKGLRELTGDYNHTYDSHAADKGLFGNCTSLTNVTIGSEVQTIGYSCFDGCSALRTITIPGNVQKIQPWAFLGCTYLETVRVGNGVTEIMREAFYGLANLKNLTLGSSLVTIRQSAFENCSRLKNVAFPAGLDVIEAYAFRGCAAMTEVELPDSLAEIGMGAFSGCTSLKDLNTGNGLRELTGDYNHTYDSHVAEKGLFGNCTSLTNVTIGSNVLTIGYSCFDGCSALRTITIPGNVQKIQPWAFLGCTYLETVRVGNGVTEIMREVFYGLANLKNVSFGTELVTVGDSVFNGCSLLRNVAFPSKLDKIGEYAFHGCAAMTEVELPDSLHEIGLGAFSGCTQLRSANTGNGLTVLTGDYNHTYSSHVAEKGLFGNCTSLTNVTIGSEVQTIGYSCFDGCSSLRTITIPDNVRKIQRWAFCGCAGLDKVVVGNGVTDIETEAFYGDVALRLVRLGTSVDSIGSKVFGNCSGLHYVEFTGAEAPTDVASDIFSGVKERMMVYVAPDSTGWTALYQPGLPETWQGRPIAYAPPPEGAGNPYDFYPYVPTARVSGRDYSWPSPLMLTKTRYLHGSTVPETVAEFKQGEAIYLNFAFDEYWRGNMFENLTNTFALSGEKAATEDVVKTVTSLNYAYCWGTNVTLNILKDLAPGDYTLTMNLNPGRNLAETDYANNTTSLTFRVVGRASYTVKFDAHGGVPAPEARTLYEGTEVGELPAVTRNGHVFDGWYTAETGGSKIDATTWVTADVTYHAQWKKLPNIIFWKPLDDTWTETMFVAAKYGAKSGQAVFAEGDPVYFYYACYEQDGQRVSDSFVNRLKIVGDNGFELSRSQTIYGITPGTCEGTYGQKITMLQNLKPGIYTLTCTLNADNDVAEFDTSDNVQTVSFKVVPAESPTGEDEPGVSDVPGLPTPTTPPAIVTEVTGAVPTGGATYTGYIYGDGGRVIGTFTLVVGKQKGGICTLKLTRIDLMTGQKVTDRASLDVATGLADGVLTGLQIGADGVLGTIASVGKLAGGLDVVKAKDETRLPVLGQFDARGCAIAFSSMPVSGAGAAFAYGNFGFTVTFGKKGKAKVAGVLPDGTKVSLTSQLILGRDVCCLPVMYAKKNKGSFGFLLWFDPQTTTVTAMTGITPLVSSGKTPYEATVKCLGVGALGGYLDAGTTFNAQFGVLPLSFRVVTIDTTKAGISILPNGVAVDGSVSKWKLPKAGKVTLTKDKKDLDVDKFTAKGEPAMNPAALKLAYTEKKGTFKGSFTLYQDATKNDKPKLKKVTATVNGIVVNGVGYGSAVIKKVGSMPVVIDVVK